MIRRPVLLLTPLLLALAALPDVARAQAAPAGVPDRESEVDRIFQRYDSRQTPGCSVAVIDAGEVVLKKSYGMADIALGVPMSSSTSHWIPYSEARVFVALAAAMLARDGLVGLDDPIRSHVPEVPAYASAVTVRQLLHHASGLADYGVLAGPGFALGDRLSEDEMLRMLSRWGALVFEPDTGHVYSNTDYALLKILVERVSGGTLHAYLDKTLLGPMGMSATRIGADQANFQPGHALFHERDGEGFRRLLRYRISPVGGISVTTTLDDLVRFDQAMNDPALGLRALLRDLEKGAPPAPAGSGSTGFLFGVYRSNDGSPMTEFRGIGEYTWLVQAPGERLSVATLCNAYDGMWSFGPDVARLYAAPSPPVTPPAAVASTESALAGRDRIDATSEQLEAHVGVYRSADGNLVMEVALQDGVLAIAPRGPGPQVPALEPVGPGQFEAVVNGILHAFAFSPGVDGMALEIREAASNEPAAPPLARWAEWEPSPAVLADYPGTYVGENVEVVLHIRTDGRRVLLASRGFAESALTPLDTADRFSLPDTYTARFERNDGGRVVALVLDANRVKDIRFLRQ